MNNFVQGGENTKAGAVVATYTIEDENINGVIVVLNDSVNYALDTNRQVILTEKGAALVNAGKDLPAFTLTPNDGKQNGMSIKADPAITTANIDVVSIETFMQTDTDIKAGDVVATYNLGDQASASTVTVSLSDTTHYQLDNNNHVVLTQAGVDLITSGKELPQFVLTPNDGAADGAKVIIDPEIDNVPTLTITDTNTFVANDDATKIGAVVATYEVSDEEASTVTVALSDTVNYALNGKGGVMLTAKGVELINSGEELPEFTLTPIDNLGQSGTPIVGVMVTEPNPNVAYSMADNTVEMSNLSLNDVISGSQDMLYNASVTTDMHSPQVSYGVDIHYTNGIDANYMNNEITANIL